MGWGRGLSIAAPRVVSLMERMIDAIADYYDLDQPGRVEWEAA